MTVRRVRVRIIEDPEPVMLLVVLNVIAWGAFFVAYWLWGPK